MMKDVHRTQVLQAMPPEKASEKRTKTFLGAGIAIFGALACVGAFVALVAMITNGTTLDKWSAGIVGVFFLSGLAMVGQGSHMMSGELTRAAWKDMAATVRSVWRRAS